MGQKHVNAVLVAALSVLVVVTECCKPCHEVECGDTSKCKNGVIKDMCGCCDVCAKDEGDSCGGLFHFHGKCGVGLTCVSRRPNSVKILGENDYISGVCEPTACGNKKCGYNQRCQLNSRGKARCVCPRYCRNRYMPVCGLTNGKHYWNRCFLRKDECRVQKRIGYVTGPCKSCYEKGKAYKFGDKIRRKDSCEICNCQHGKWKCEQDFGCQAQLNIPALCDVKENNCAEGFVCQGGKYEPAIDVVNIGIGFCIPEDEERTSSDQVPSGDGKCPQLKCAHCRHGYKKDSQGCKTCECMTDAQMMSQRLKNKKVAHKEKSRSVVRKNICFRAKFQGPCLAHMERYYYNSQKGKCVKFIFGGCLSNGNNFSTKKKCEKRCMKETTK